MYADTVRYYFQSKELGRELVPEPRNYRDGNGAKYRRDATSKGIMRVSSNELEWVGSAYDYLLKANALYGVVIDIRVDKWIKHEKRMDERWTYVGSFGVDLTNLEFDHDNGVVKASYTNGGLADKLQSRWNEEYDLLLTESVTGDDIGAMQTVNCTFPGKAIFLESRLAVDSGVIINSPVTGDPHNVRAVPFKVVTNPDGEQFNNDREHVYSITAPELGYDNDSISDGGEGGIMYLNSERDRVLKLRGRVHFDLSNTDAGFLQFGIIKYHNGLDLNFKEFISFHTINTNGTEKIDHTFNDYELTVEQGESFTVGYYSNTSDGIAVRYLDGNAISIVDENPAPPTVARCVTQLYMFDRIMARAFGSHGLVRSDLLERGEMADTLKTNGLFIRQFPDIVNEGTNEERRTQFKTSLKKQRDAVNTIHPIAYWVAKIGDKEVLRIEKLTYTQQNFTGIHYGEKDANGKVRYIPPQKVVRKVLRGNYYSSSEIGSVKTGENYDDFFGLTSFCGKAVYNFINDVKGVPYVATTEDRTGDLDIELWRRKPFDKFPDEDTAGDDDMHFIDAKKSGSGYVPRTWQDDFEEAPKNVYRPETAFNFRYSPARLLLNHGYVLNAGLQHYPEESAKFASSNCNSSLITKLVGEEELKEGSPVSHSRFGKARIRPMSVDFDMPVPMEVENAINGIRPDGTPNWYGRVAVQINGYVEYMRMVDVDSNKNGKHKMVEAV